MEIDTYQCTSCQGRLRAGTTSYALRRNGYYLVLDSVPALLCKECGEPLFTDEAVRVVQQMVRNLDEQSKQLQRLVALA